MDWLKFLRPDIKKIGLTLIFPFAFGFLVTRRLENVMDFYGYLLTPAIAYWDGVSLTYLFNRYLLLWIPFYLTACVVVYLIDRRK